MAKSSAYNYFPISSGISAMILLMAIANNVGEGGATRSGGAKRFSAIIAKLRIAKNSYLANSCK